MEFSTISPPWKVTIGDISQKQEEIKIHCSLLSFIYPMKRAGQELPLHAVMEFQKRHPPRIQKLEKGLAHREPGQRSRMLRKIGARSQAINFFFSCFTVISQIKGDLGL